MGGGSWDTSMYRSAVSSRKAAGVDDFGYDADVRSGRASGIHSDLDPSKMRNGIRESRDSDEHPNSVPLAVFFDVTGSMGDIPLVMQKKLPKLMETVVEKAGLNDVQVLVGAIGDSTCDSMPFQVGQFESDNRYDEQLRNIVIEGGGGAYGMESYALAYYFVANHTSIDSFEKRGKKGYLFTIGDEEPWPTVTVDDASKIFGIQAEKDESVQNLIARASEQWEIFHFMPTERGSGDGILTAWDKLLGQRVVKIDDAGLICEAIAGIVHMKESSLGVDDVVSDMKLSGDECVAVKNALAPLAGTGVSGGLAKGIVPKRKGKSDGMTRI